jgi:hypothetical protein
MIVSSIIRKKTASNTSRGGRDPLRGVDQIVLEVVREISFVRLLAFDPKLGALE